MPSPSLAEGGIPSVLFNPAGLTGVWADENTRDAIFDGLRLYRFKIDAWYLTWGS